MAAGANFPLVIPFHGIITCYYLLLLASFGGYFGGGYFLEVEVVCVFKEIVSTCVGYVRCIETRNGANERFHAGAQRLNTCGQYHLAVVGVRDRLRS